MTVDNSNVVNTLSDLADTCRDGQKGYQDAADHAKDGELKRLFLEISLERARMAGQLEAELNSLGGKGKPQDGHVVGALHRAWIDVKESLGAGDHAILAWLEQGDDYAKGKYEKALQSKLPHNINDIVQQQAQKILSDHDRIKLLRDTRKAA